MTTIHSEIYNAERKANSEGSIVYVVMVSDVGGRQVELSRHSDIRDAHDVAIANRNRQPRVIAQPSV